MRALAQSIATVAAGQSPVAAMIRLGLAQGENLAMYMGSSVPKTSVLRESAINSEEVASRAFIQKYIKGRIARAK